MRRCIIMVLCMLLAQSVSAQSNITISNMRVSQYSASLSITWDLRPSFNNRVDVHCNSVVVYKDQQGRRIGTDKYFHGTKNGWGPLGDQSFSWSIDWRALTEGRKPKGTHSIEVAYVFSANGFASVPQFKVFELTKSPNVRVKVTL